MPEHKTPALVLDIKDFGEADRIVTFLTSRFGKLKGIAKSAKKSQRRFGAALDLFSHVELSFFSKETLGLLRINSCHLLQNFPAIHHDLSRMAYASYLAELLNEMTAEGDRHPDLFEMSISFFSILDTSAPREDVLRLFEMRLLNATGYRPALNHCVGCRRTWQKAENTWFCIAKGGLLCEACVSGEKKVYPVSPGTARLLELAGTIAHDKLQRLVFSPRALAEAREFLPHFIQHQLGKELVTLKFLEKTREDKER
jgi:DNA repair protein RecO (recombination protein O)